MVELVKPSEETNSEPSQFWYINTSSAQVPDNTSLTPDQNTGQAQGFSSESDQQLWPAEP